MRRVLGGGFLAGIALALLAALGGQQPARAAVLYDQMDNRAGVGIASENAPADSDAFDSQSADDFTVPVGSVWSVSTVTVSATTQGSPDPSSFNVFFYADAGPTPGTLIASRADAGYTKVARDGFNDYVITLVPPVELAAGSYWVSVQANMAAFGSGVQRWFWETRAVQSGDRAVFQNPGGGYGTCPTWCPLEVTNPDRPDLMFALGGTETVTGDLGINKTNNTSEVVAGTSTTYTITVTNAGPGTATGATVTDTFNPDTLTNVRWTCSATPGSACSNTSGTGNINEPVTVAAGGTVTFTATADVPANVSEGYSSVVNTATVTPPANFSDTPGSPNSSTDIDEIKRQFDLAINKTDDATTSAPGRPITYTITVTNAGPSQGRAFLHDIFPDTISNVTWTCTATGGSLCDGAAGSGDIHTVPVFAVGGTVTYTATGTISPSASGTLSNTASVSTTAGVGDPNQANNTSTDTNQLVRHADLAISKDCGPAATALPGQTYNCTLSVSNTGPSDAENVVVNDDLSPNTTLVSGPTSTGFSCVPGDPFTCTRSPLMAGESATITYTVRVDDNVGGGASLNNTATVSSSTQDPRSDNNSATTVKSTPGCTIDLSGATSSQSIRGTSGDDVICGSPYADSIQGMGGNDIIFGNGGNDSIQGGEGNDQLFGGVGDDTLSGPPGIDSANGGVGYDRCVSRNNSNCEAAQIA